MPAGLKQSGVAAKWRKIGLSGAFLGICCLVALNWSRQKSLHGCGANEKQLAIALEKWFLANNAYPKNLSQLVPSHLLSIPTCPAAGYDTYSESYSADESGNFKLFCKGHYHAHKDFPQYDGVIGFYEAPLHYTIRLPHEPRTLGSADTEYGRAEVDRMMRDRPGMSQIVDRGDVIFEWAARRFGGLSCGQRITWKSEAFFSDSRAINSPPTSARQGSISIRAVYRGRPLTPQQLWYCAVFELYNISNGPVWGEQEEFARKGLLSRSRFIDQGTRLEYLSDRKTNFFFTNVWIAYVTAKGLSVESSSWRTDMPWTFSDWKDRFYDPAGKGYPYNNFGVRYDQLVTKGAASGEPLSKKAKN